MLISAMSNYDINNLYKPSKKSEKSAVSTKTSEEKETISPRSELVEKRGITMEEFDRQYSQMNARRKIFEKRELEQLREFRAQRRKKLLKAHVKKLQIKREVYEKAIISETGERRQIASKYKGELLPDKTALNTAEKDPVLLANAIAAYKASVYARPYQILCKTE